MSSIYIAHRGSKVNGGVENTKEAFLGGVKAKAAGLECDIRFTSDNRIIIFHDSTVERLTKEDDIYHFVNVNNETFDNIRKINLTQEYNNKVYSGHICSFDEYLEICVKYNMIPVIELKWTNGVYSDDTNKDIYDFSNIANVINKIKEYNLLDKCYIISFMGECLNYIKTNYPNIKLQWLCSHNYNDRLNWCIDNKIDIDINYNYCTKEIVELFHNNNLKVNIWTLNNEELLSTYVDMGVDMITSDYIIKEGL